MRFCIMAACCCICSMSSSSDCGGLSPKRSAYLSMKPSKSGSSPAMRWCSMFVEVLDHVAHEVHVLGGHVLDGLGDVVGEAVEHLLAEGVEEFLVFLLGVGVHEFVVAEAAELAGGVVGEIVEGALFAFDDVVEHLGELGGFVRGTGLPGWSWSDGAGWAGWGGGG